MLGAEQSNGHFASIANRQLTHADRVRILSKEMLVLRHLSSFRHFGELA
jgi:hypothetical protein